MRKRRKELKTKVYIRDSTNPIFSKMILIYPDGKVCAAQFGDSWNDDPCYGVGKNQRETIKRMRKFEKLKNMRPAELIGEV